MTLTIDTGTAIGIVASVVTFVSFLCRKMIWLRFLGIVANLLFIAYGYMNVVLPTLILNVLLLLLNGGRLLEILKLTRTIEAADHTTPLSKWLIPHMRKRHVRAGTVVFRKGERADSIIVATSGRLELQELHKEVKLGELVGEIGLFSPEKSRTQTLVAVTDCHIHQLSGDELFRLYYQNPAMGFHVIRLIVERLMMDIQRYQASEPSTATQG